LCLPSDMSEFAITFLGEQVIPCKNNDCTVDTFRMRLYLDSTPNGKPEWSIERVNPMCPSCNMNNHDVKGWGI